MPLGDWGVTVRNASTVLLDDLREARRVVSDYALAKQLGVRQQTISNYRSGVSRMSDEIALRVAEMLDRNPAPSLAELAAERAKDPRVAKVWRDAAKVVSRTK